MVYLNIDENLILILKLTLMGNYFFFFSLLKLPID